VADPEDQHGQLVVHDVVDDSVVADPDAQFAVAALERDATGRSRVVRKTGDRLEDSPSGLSIEHAESFPRRSDVGDPVRHGSEAELSCQILVGDALSLLACGRRGANVGLIFQRLERTIVELRGYDNCTSTSAAGRDLDGLALRRGDEVGLTVAEVGEGHGSHAFTVHLVQDDGNGVGSPEVDSRGDVVEFRFNV